MEAKKDRRETSGWKYKMKGPQRGREWPQVVPNSGCRAKEEGAASIWASGTTVAPLPRPHTLQLLAQLWVRPESARALGRYLTSTGRGGRHAHAVHGDHRGHRGYKVRREAWKALSKHRDSYPSQLASLTNRRQPESP